MSAINGYQMIMRRYGSKLLPNVIAATSENIY